LQNRILQPLFLKLQIANQRFQLQKRSGPPSSVPDRNGS
jgi:hypothetical protein